MILGENSRKPVFGFRLLGERNFAKVSGCIRATHFIGSNKKYIYDTGIDDEEIQWEIEDFKAHYPHTWWTVEQINYND